MDLFSVVCLAKPTLVVVGVRPLKEGKEPVLQATAGRIMELAQEETESGSHTVLEPTPVQSITPSEVQPPQTELSRTESSDGVEIVFVESGPAVESQGVKRKNVSGNDGAGTSKRRRHLIDGAESSSEEESPHTAETPSPK